MQLRKALRKMHETRYRELEGQLQKQEQLYRTLVRVSIRLIKRELQLRENLEISDATVQ